MEVGTEISQKIRSAIKAKLMELGAYVDDELPDYIMVMVANKRSRAQMRNDLCLFLGTNTNSFTDWLHKLLAKLQAVRSGDTQTSVISKQEKPSKLKRKDKERSTIEKNNPPLTKRKNESDVETGTSEINGTPSAAKRKPTVATAILSETQDKSEEIYDMHVDAVGVEGSDSQQISSDKEVDQAPEDFSYSSDVPAEKIQVNTNNIVSENIRHISTEEHDSISENTIKQNCETLGGDQSLISELAAEKIIAVDGVLNSNNLTTSCLSIQSSDVCEKSSAATPDNTESVTLTLISDEVFKVSKLEHTTDPQDEAVKINILGVKTDRALLLRAITEAEQAIATKRHGAVSGPAACDTSHSESCTLSKQSGPSAFLSQRGDGAVFPEESNNCNLIHNKKDCRELISEFRRNELLRNLGIVRKSPSLILTQSLTACKNWNKETRNRTYQIHAKTNQGSDCHSTAFYDTIKGDRSSSEQKCSTENTGGSCHEIRLSAMLRPAAYNNGQAQVSREERGSCTNKFITSGNRMDAVEDRINTQSGVSKLESVLQKKIATCGCKNPVTALTVSSRVVSKHHRAEVGIAIAGGRYKSHCTGCGTFLEARLSEQCSDPNCKQKYVALQKHDTNRTSLNKSRQVGENLAGHMGRMSEPDLIAESDEVPTCIAQLSHSVEEKSTEKKSGVKFIVTLDGVNESQFNLKESTDTSRPGKNVKPALTTKLMAKASVLYTQVTASPNVPVASHEALAIANRGLQRETKKEDLKNKASASSHVSSLKASASTVCHHKGPLVGVAKTRISHHEVSFTDDLNLLSTVQPAHPTERCKFWPACASGSSCQFYHPTTLCKTFPNCRFGTGCLFIHPNCRFDAKCTNIDCPYTHTSRRWSPSVCLLIQPAPKPAFLHTGHQVLCRFFPNCHNAECSFLHPKVCKFSAGCRNAACSFYHPSGQDKSVLKWRNMSSHPSLKSAHVSHPPNRPFVGSKSSYF